MFLIGKYGGNIGLYGRVLILLPKVFAFVYTGTINEIEREQRFFRCSLSLLVCHKARNTADENILYFLLGVQTLSRLVEMIRLELTTYTLRTYRSTG